MDIRILTDDSLQDGYYLSSQAFRCGIRDDGFGEARRTDPNRLPATTFGIHDAGGLQAKVVVIHYNQVFGPGHIAPMGGIAGVACLPASRGKGYASAGLNHALAFMRDSGMYLSALYPFSWEYYRKLGWEWTGRQRVYTVPTRILKVCDHTDQVRAAGPADACQIAAVYDAFARKHRGMVQRDDKMWSRVLADTQQKYTYTYLYEGATGPEGYLTFNDQSRDTTFIEEFVCLNPTARHALLGLLKRHEMQVNAFRWRAPESDTLWTDVMHNDLSTTLEPVVQSRVVDVAAALGALHPAENLRGALRVKVKDHTADWNDGLFLVESNEGSCLAVRTQGEPDVSMDIQALTQAYYGSPDLDELRESKRIDVSNESAYELLKGLLCGPTMWLNDHF